LVSAVSSPPHPHRFPTGFLWGSSTSAHQVEGNNVSSDWWEFEQQGRVPYRSGAACRHYELFEKDFDLARSLGHNAHRFSIEWSRVEPAEGTWNADAVEHYRHVIRALRARELEPIVTLHHFTNPGWFLRRGGWARSDSPALFERYVGHVANAFDSNVSYWVTINEPTVYAMQGYIFGEWPPCLKRRWLAAARVLRNLARAHVAAYRLLHRHLPDVKVGFAHSAPVIVPCNPARLRDRAAAGARDAVLNRAFFRLVGARAEPGSARAPLDFIGLNYYTRNAVRSAGWGSGALVGRACNIAHHGNDGPRSSMGWEVFPDGLRATLDRFSRYGLPMLVTENGIATQDEQLRSEYVARHLEILGDAAAAGLDVAGYLYWSLIDNFEWAEGTAPRFGLAAVDYATQERRPRPAAWILEQACRGSRRSDLNHS
jgi:beta-glucosidase